MRDVSATELRLAIQSKNFTLVKFHAAWCQPCKVMTPTLEKVLEEYPKLTAVKLDTDHYPDFVRQMNIPGIPAILIFRNGVEVARLVGAHSKPTIVRFIDLICTKETAVEVTSAMVSAEPPRQDDKSKPNGVEITVAQTMATGKKRRKI